MKMVDLKGLLPKYQQLRGLLLEELGQDRYAVGRRFPSENELAKRFDISPLTVRKALSLLEQEGFLQRQQGIGTFVKSVPSTPRKLSVIEECSIGLLVGEDMTGEDVAFQKLVFGIEKEALDRSYLLQLARAVRGRLPRMITGGHVDGVLHLGTVRAETARELEGMPTVVIGHWVNNPGLGFHSIRADAVLAGRQAGAYLAQLGHRHIGIVGGDSLVAWLSSSILAGLREALSAAGLGENEKLFKVDPERDDYTLTAELLDSGEEVTALLLGNWLGSAQSLQAVAERGLTIPDDLSVVAYGDNVLSMHTRPALTAVKLFSEEVGGKAVELLLEAIKNPKRPPETVLYPTALLERGSCRERG